MIGDQRKITWIVNYVFEFYRNGMQYMYIWLYLHSKSKAKEPTLGPASIFEVILLPKEGRLLMQDLSHQPYAGLVT